MARKFIRAQDELVGSALAFQPIQFFSNSLSPFYIFYQFQI